MNGKGFINATKNSFDIIEVLKDLDGATNGQISDELGLAKSTVHNHLLTLEELGYVVQENGIYFPALKFFNIGIHTTNRINGLEIIYQRSEELAAKTNEEVDFNVEENGRIIALYHEISSHSNPGFQVGRYFHMHNSASGKAILAEMPLYRVDEIIDKWGLPKETEFTITSRDVLLRDLDETRSRGYSFCDQEWVEGFCSIGTVITYPNDSIYGAMSVGGPTYRMDTDLIHGEYSQLLLDTARKIERDLEQR